MAVAANLLSLALSSDTWTAVGSVATAIAVLVAAGSLVFQLQGGVKSEAVEVRRQIQAFRLRANQLIGLLEDNSLLIDASHRTSSSLLRHAGKDPTADDVRSLIGNPEIAAAAAVEGWESSPARERFHVAMSALGAADVELTGRLDVFSPTTKLLRRFVNDAYSPPIHIRLLTEKTGEAFVAEHRTDQLEPLIRALTAHLLSGAATYNLRHSAPAIAAIRDFIKLTSLLLLDLGPRHLVAASQKKEWVGGRSTLTEELTVLVEALRDTLPEDRVEWLLSDVEEIERKIGEELELERLARV